MFHKSKEGIVLFFFHGLEYLASGDCPIVVLQKCMDELLLRLEFLGPLEVVEVAEFFLEQVFEDDVGLFGSIFEYGLLKESVLVLFFIDTLDEHWQAGQNRRRIFLLLDLRLPVDFIEGLELFSIDIDHSSRK